MNLTSVNLAGVPFCSSCDSTRLNMSSKQFSQSLTSKHSEIPYVISQEWRSLRDSSPTGIFIAPKNGEVLFNCNDLICVMYEDGTYDLKKVPPIVKSISIYASTLRSSLPKGTKFQKGDIIYEYDSFRMGVPASGMNTWVAYIPFFGFTHEDSLTISESFAERDIHNYVETVYVPIFEHTILQKLYTNMIGYLPDIGDKVKDGIVCSWLIPMESRVKKDCMDPQSVKTRVMSLLQNMNLSDLISMQANGCSAGFSLEAVKTRLENGVITGIKIHKLDNDARLVDQNLQKVLNLLYSRYCDVIVNIYNNLLGYFPKEKINEIVKTHYCYTDKERVRGDIHFKDAAFLLEFEIQEEKCIHIGDKLSSRHASKGVVSLILPDELRPVTVETKQPIDYIYNPFGVFSRMNLSQLLECVVSKSVWYSDQSIRKNPDSLISELKRLSETTLQYLGNPEYYDRVEKLIQILEQDPTKRKEFLDQVISNNLFVEVPSFANIDIQSMQQHIRPKVNEPLRIPKKTVDYMKQKFGCFDEYIINEDIVLDHIFCSNIYVQKLNKIADKVFNVRDLGSIKSLTGQPHRGRSKVGGSRLGQMEVEAILANGCTKTLKEFFSVKNDWASEKKNLITSLIQTGSYQLPSNIPADQSRTKTAVNSVLKFLKD